MQNTGSWFICVRQYQSWLTDCKLTGRRFTANLNGETAERRSSEVLEERDALYREVAHIIIDAQTNPAR